MKKTQRRELYEEVLRHSFPSLDPFSEVGRAVGARVGCFEGWLLGCFKGWLVGCFKGWLLGCFAGWLSGPSFPSLGGVQMMFDDGRSSTNTFVECRSAGGRGSPVSVFRSVSVGWGRTPLLLDGRSTGIAGEPASPLSPPYPQSRSRRFEWMDLDSSWGLS